MLMHWADHFSGPRIRLWIVTVRRNGRLAIAWPLVQKRCGGLSVLLQMGAYQPVTFSRWQGGRVVAMMPLVNGLYATATLIGERVQVALSSEQARLERGDIKTGQSATEVSGAPGEWLTVGELSTTQGSQGAAIANPSGINTASGSERQTLQIRVTRQ